MTRINPGIADAPRMSYDKPVIFERLALWIDPVERPGPEAMAVDEWLLETSQVPVLRVYRWLGEWGSIGYFGDLAEAANALPGLEWVRRWTGGGTVDHRRDWTYTVVAPAGHALSGLRGADSYRLLHQALAETLRFENTDAQLASGAGQTGASLCFHNPVGFDLIDPQGVKLAGAGQRRTRHGLLHQGSLAAPCDPATSANRAKKLATCLAADWHPTELHPPPNCITQKLLARYANPNWRTPTTTSPQPRHST